MASGSSTCATHLVAKKDTKSKVQVYFVFKGNESGEIIDDKTVLCHLSLPIDKTKIPYTGGTTNLLTHLQRHHKSHYMELMGRSTSTSTSTGHKQGTLTDMSVKHKPLPASSERHKQLVQAIGNFITMDMQATTTIEGRGFVQLMNLAEPRFKIQSYKDLIQYIIMLVLCFVNIKDVEHQSNTFFSIHLYFLLITTSTGSSRSTIQKQY